MKRRQQMGLFKKKPPTPEQIAAEEAKSFFDCICPSTVKFFPHHYIVGDSYRWRNTGITIPMQNLSIPKISSRESVWD